MSATILPFIALDEKFRLDVDALAAKVAAIGEDPAGLLKMAIPDARQRG